MPRRVPCRVPRRVPRRAKSAASAASADRVANRSPCAESAGRAALRQEPLLPNARGTRTRARQPPLSCSSTPRLVLARCLARAGSDATHRKHRAESSLVPLNGVHPSRRSNRQSLLGLRHVQRNQQSLLCLRHRRCAPSPLGRRRCRRLTAHTAQTRRQRSSHCVDCTKAIAK